MTLIVRLIDDEKSVFVAHLVEHGRIGIMTRPDGIEIVTLYHLQIPAHMLHIHDRTCHGVGIMAVDTAEFDGLTVDLEYVSVDFHFPDPNPVRNDLPVRLKDDGVEIGILAVPQVRIIDCKGSTPAQSKAFDHFFLRVQDSDSNRDLQVQIGSSDRNLGAYCPGQEIRLFRFSCFLPGFRTVCGACFFRVTSTDRCAFPVLRVLLPADFRVDKIVENALSRPAHQVDIPEDSRHAEFVLVLEIASIAPFQDKYGENIFPFLQGISDFKLGKSMGDLAVADIVSVQPDVKTGINTFKLQESPG